MDKKKRRLLDIVVLIAKDGKKAAEPFCSDCHNADVVPFPPEHPLKNRCLICHKLD